MYVPNNVDKNHFRLKIHDSSAFTMFAPPTAVGCPIPENTPHAISVTLPTWKSNVAYEEGEEWVTSAMKSGYPRFFIHLEIQKLAKFFEEKYGRENESCFIFPSYAIALRCREFLKKNIEPSLRQKVRILQLSTPQGENSNSFAESVTASFIIVFFPKEFYSLGKAYWQHSGEGISSRMAEFGIEKFFGAKDKSKESASFLEERYGRNLDPCLFNDAKNALKNRVANQISDGISDSIVSSDDVYLYPTGMASIFNAHRIILQSRDEQLKSVCFGFPYVDTRNILQKFGAGYHFFGYGNDDDLEKLEELLKQGEKILALFCEFPSNPLLRSPNLVGLRKLADEYDFLIVVDETVGNFSNVHVLPYADIVTSSLTKVFSGDSNVMGGSLVLNSQQRYYKELKEVIEKDYESNFWIEDIIYLERNSRTFKERSTKVNDTAEAVVDLFKNSPHIKTVYYPKLNESKKYYDVCRKTNGGYGGLLSIIFHNEEHAEMFYDHVATAKGPSLGTNFTLVSPYAILAHYPELDYVAQFGVPRSLIRISVGLEEKEALCKVFSDALDHIE